VTQRPAPVWPPLMANNQGFGLFDSIAAKAQATSGDPWSKSWILAHGDLAGHGPYTVQDHQPGVQTTFAAFKDYHRGTPPVDPIVYREIDSTSTRATLLSGGSIDVAYDLLPTELQSLSKTSGITVDDFNVGRSLGLWFVMNNQKPPFNNRLVRQALSYAAPYSTIVEDVYKGYASEWRGIFSRDVPHFSDSFWPYGDGGNVAKAKSLLRQAGYGKGFSAEVLYDSGSATSELVAIQLQTAYQRIGVKLTLKKIATAAF